MPITAEQCRMARAALNLGVRELAKEADVAPNTILRLERGDPLHRRTHDFIQAYFEAEGVTFVGQQSIAVGGYGKMFQMLWGLPDRRRDPEAAYHALLAIMSQFLTVIAEQQREPDMWERLALNHVLKDLDRSDVFAAHSDMLVAITPPDNRSPESKIDPDDVTALASHDLAFLRRCAASLSARGYKHQQ